MIRSLHALILRNGNVVRHRSPAPPRWHGISPAATAWPTTRCGTGTRVAVPGDGRGLSGAL